MTASTRQVLYAELARLGGRGPVIDVRDEVRCGVEFSGFSDESLGEYQQRFLALLAHLERLAPLRVVGRVEADGAPGSWAHLVSSEAAVDLSLVRHSLDALGLQAVRCVACSIAP